MSPKSREQDRSCRICGCFVPRETQAGNVGYCLYYEDQTIRGESLKIPDGAADKVASKCRAYFRRIPGMMPHEFVRWRTAIMQHEIAERTEKLHKRIELEVRIFGLIVGGVALIQFALDLVGK